MEVRNQIRGSDGCTTSPFSRDPQGSVPLMRTSKNILASFVLLTSGCAAWPQAAQSPNRPLREAPEPAGRDPFQNAPVIPDPNALVLPRVQLGQATSAPPTQSTRPQPAVTASPVVATPAAASPWRSDFESAGRRRIETALRGSGLEPVLVTGSLNGNDPHSIRLMDALIALIDAHPEKLDGLTAQLVRDPNPDALAEHISVNSRGVDLNRNFPSNRFTANPTAQTGPHPASEVETRVLLRLLGDLQPKRVIHIRTGGGRRALVTGNAASLELLGELDDRYDVLATTFDGEFKAGSFEEFAATRLKAQVLIVEVPEGVESPEKTAELLLSALVGTGKNTQTPPDYQHAPPIASSPESLYDSGTGGGPASLTGRVEPEGPDGERGYVELLPPPPEFAGVTDEASDPRYHELPPP
jgi:hypothetical protein